jgi:hypothetical protein
MKDNNLKAPDVDYLAAPSKEGEKKDEGEVAPDTSAEVEEGKEPSPGYENSEKNEHSEKKLSSSSPQWSAQYTPVMVGKEEISLSNLNLSLQGSNFAVKRGLCIVVADRSGSMAWSTRNAENMTPETPWKQVETRVWLCRTGSGRL